MISIKSYQGKNGFRKFQNPLEPGNFCLINFENFIK